MPPVTIDKFNGLYLRGENDIPGLDHQVEAKNFIYRSGQPVRRPALVAAVNESYRQAWTWQRGGEKESLIALRGGALYHVTNITSGTPVETLLYTITGMDGFSCDALYDRVYISPIKAGRGMEDEKTYVYDGTSFMSAAAPMPTGTLTPTATSRGGITAGFRRVAIAYETETGHISVPGPDTPPSVTTTSDNATIQVAMPTPPTFAAGGSKYVKKHLLISDIVETEFQGDTYARQLVYYYAPDGRDLDLDDSSIDLDFLDSELVAEASELFDQLEEIPAGTQVLAWANRLLVLGSDDDPHIMWVSESGRPERINSVNGFLEIERSKGIGLTNAIGYYSSIHVFKESRSDIVLPNANPPAFWDSIPLDPSVGTHCNGISFTIGEKQVVRDRYLVCSSQGLMMFDGRSFSSDLGWKINEPWIARARNFEHRACVTIDTQNLLVHWLIPDRIGTQEMNRLFVGEYSDGLSFDSMRWSEWTPELNTAREPIRHVFLVNSLAGWRSGICLNSGACISSSTMNRDSFGGVTQAIRTELQTSPVRNPLNYAFVVNKVDVLTGPGYASSEVNGHLSVRLLHKDRSFTLGTVDNSLGLNTLPTQIQSERLAVRLLGQDASNFGIERITMHMGDAVRQLPIGMVDRSVPDGDGPEGSYWGYNGAYWGYNGAYWGYE